MDTMLNVELRDEEAILVRTLVHDRLTHCERNVTRFDTPIDGANAEMEATARKYWQSERDLAASILEAFEVAQRESGDWA